MKKSIVLESFEEISENIWIDRFNEFLDQDIPAVKIFNSTFPASRILYKCDPIQYNYELENFKELWEAEYGDTDIDTDETEAEEVVEDTNAENDGFVAESISEIEILSTSLDSDISLGVSDNIFYIKQGKDGSWNEIPADTEEEAIAYFNDVVSSTRAETDEDYSPTDSNFTELLKSIKTFCQSPPF